MAEEREQKVMEFANIDDLLEHLVEHFKQSAGDPAADQAIHDIPLIRKYIKEVEDNPLTMWHNASLKIVLEYLSPIIMRAMIDNPLEVMANPEIMIDKFAMIMEWMFIAGYNAGEGPEHIYHCTADH